MRLYEYEAKKLFESVGLTVPRQYGVIHTDADLAGLDLAFPVMLKSMVLTGGRGKAGGIAKANDDDAAREAARSLLGSSIRGYRVESVLVEQAVVEAGACYVGVTTNPATYNVVVMVSAAGGVEIEKVALEQPDAILRIELRENDRELPETTAEEMAAFLARSLGAESDLAALLSQAVSRVFSAYQGYDCKVAEVNPLIITADGEVVCADAKIVIDDNALYRQSALLGKLGIAEARHDVSELTADERRARDAGFPYVDLLGEDIRRDPDKLYVGLVPGGAGYGIFSIDEVANIGERFFDGKVVPVNFMDSGGGPSLERVAEMFHLLMDKAIVDIVITSRFGGISSCDTFIRGLVECLRDRHADGRRVLPVHGRMVGTDLPSARSHLEKAKAETPEPLADLEITVGNREIMADVIRAGIAKGFAARAGTSATRKGG